MASFQAIAATGQAMLGLLADAVPKPEFANAQFGLYQLADFQSPMEEGAPQVIPLVSPIRLTTFGSR